ncbi:MAG: DUF364 domain-containing protein [Deltaproteobacteria bacterium]|nr:DUF364 domain-containing protein [Deltaproteobacteria bacterium]
MNIIDDLVSACGPNAPVDHLLMGCFFSAVCSRGCGLSSVLRPRRGLHEVDPMPSAGDILPAGALDLASFARSERLLEASIGLASINSLLTPPLDRGIKVNAADVLVQRASGRNVAVIGGFPFAKRVRSVAQRVDVFELDPIPEADERHTSEAFEYLPDADVVVISGTTLINHTFEGLMKLVAPGAFVMMVGPSTPLTPVLFDWGVHALAGAVVVDREALFRTIAQGAVFRQVRGVEKWTLSVDASQDL